ncbi:MAG: GNAT family N-acetyltransferase [Pseudohongiella sp.]|nr:GNAT family N-acetyltransferase [Pseudohongiella sp.]
MDVVIEVLTKNHCREIFDCGDSNLNKYLHRYAMQDINRRINKVFVAVDSAGSKTICAYYGLCAGTVDVVDLPILIRQKLPKYPLPVVLLSRLAVDQKHQGKGLGAVMLADALCRVTRASEVIAVYAVIVDATDSQAAGVYKQFGFLPLPSNPLKLFIPLDTIRKLVE